MLQTIPNTYAEVARAGSCANHIRHISFLGGRGGQEGGAGGGGEGGRGSFVLFDRSSSINLVSPQGL